MLKYVISYVLENGPEEMNFFNSFIDKGLLDRLNHVVKSEFGHVTYTEAIELLEKNNEKLFPLFRRNLTENNVNLYAATAEKLAMWASRDKAYYPFARSVVSGQCNSCSIAGFYLTFRGICRSLSCLGYVLGFSYLGGVSVLRGGYTGRFALQSER